MSFDNTHYGYAAKGNLYWKAEGVDTTRYNYDNPGNLNSVILPNSDDIEYIIDGQNRRIGKMVNGNFVTGWLYQDQLNPVVEVDSLGSIITRFVYGSRGNIPDYLVKDGVVYRYITDHLGSVRFLVNLNTGAIVQELDYDEFGKVLKNTNESFQPFGYAGGLYDHQTGLIRFGVRDYDAQIGRWTAKDPIGFEGNGLNFYVYVNNNPMNHFDIKGLQFGSAKDLVKQFEIIITEMYNHKEYRKEMESWNEIIKNPELVEYFNKDLACLWKRSITIKSFWFSGGPKGKAKAVEMIQQIKIEFERFNKDNCPSDSCKTDK